MAKKKEVKGFAKPLGKSYPSAHENPDIPLWLDEYNDIFSDFDPRHYSERALSEDFLVELKRASADKNEKFELLLLVPAGKRMHYDEVVIKRRMMEHFSRHYNLLHKEMHGIINRGLIVTVIGILLMFAATYLMFTYGEKTLLMSFAIVLLEPAGWFLFWEGLNQVIFESKKTTPDAKFYEKMSKCRISFMSY